MHLTVVTSNYTYHEYFIADLYTTNTTVSQN